MLIPFCFQIDALARTHWDTLNMMNGDRLALLFSFLHYYSFVCFLVYASRQFWFIPAIFFSMVVGLANGSRSANKSIHADVFLSFVFGLLIAPFLLLLVSIADAVDVEPGNFFRKSNVKIFDEDCADAFGLQLFAALLKMSSKQSVSLGSDVDKSSKSKIVESSTLDFLSLVALSLASLFDDVDTSPVFFADFSAESSFAADFTSSSKSSCNLMI